MHRRSEVVTRLPRPPSRRRWPLRRSGVARRREWPFVGASRGATHWLALRNQGLRLRFRFAAIRAGRSVSNCRPQNSGGKRALTHLATAMFDDAVGQMHTKHRAGGGDAHRHEGGRRYSSWSWARYCSEGHPEQTVGCKAPDRSLDLYLPLPPPIRHHQEDDRRDRHPCPVDSLSSCSCRLHPPPFSEVVGTGFLPTCRRAHTNSPYRPISLSALGPSATPHAPTPELAAKHYDNHTTYVNNCIVMSSVSPHARRRRSMTRSGCTRQ